MGRLACPPVFSMHTAHQCGEAPLRQAPAPGATSRAAFRLRFRLCLPLHQRLAHLVPEPRFCLVVHAPGLLVSGGTFQAQH